MARCKTLICVFFKVRYISAFTSTGGNRIFSGILDAEKQRIPHREYRKTSGSKENDF